MLKHIPVTLADQVLATVAYCEVFEYPLSSTEIWWRLLSHKVVSQQTVNQTLKRLIDQKQLFVEPSTQWYSLESTPEYARLRKQRWDFSMTKAQQLRQLVGLSRWCPWIRGVAITGSLAMHNLVQPEDDIDLMLVVAERRLWLLRPVVVLMSWLLGRGRSATQTGKDNWCFNLWLTESTLAVPEAKRDMYTAYEIIQARWILNKNKIKEKFYQENEWIGQFLPNAGQALLTTSKHQNKNAAIEQHEQSGGSGLGKAWLDGIDWLAYQLQLAYMKWHMTREVVSRQMAYFHPRDTGGIITTGWQKKIRQTNIQMPALRVLVTGVFDGLHSEHRKFLQKARELAGKNGVLMVGLESDVRVAKLKGPGRPINSQQDRKKAIEQFGVANKVLILPEQFDKPQDYEQLIVDLKPDVLAVSSHSPHLDKKRLLMAKHGGRVEVVLEHNPAVSTTLLLQQATKNE
jgi:cytidyltransferase-like protein